MDRETMVNLTGAMERAAEQMRLSMSSLWDALDHDRRVRDEQIQRFESACELQAVTALVGYETARLNHDTTKYGEEQSAPDTAVLTKLAELLKNRGVL